MRASQGRRAREKIEDGLPDGRHARLWRWTCDSFFPSCCFDAAGLEEGVSDHRHQGMSVQSGPGSAFEVVQPKLFLELLVRLFTDPSVAAASLLIVTSAGRFDT